jgi:hypothetical protein
MTAARFHALSELSVLCSKAVVCERNMASVILLQTIGWSVSEETAA